MAEFSASTCRKLAKYIRLLASDREGEVIAAVEALKRTVRADGTDIHAVADLVEQTDGSELSEAEMEKLYDAGYEAARADDVRAAEAKVPDDADGFRNVNGMPSWHAMAVFCQDRSGRLRPNEAEFVDDMTGWTTCKEPTPKQAKWLRSIYARLGGRP